MASTTTELSISPAGVKPKTGSDALEAEAIGLEVAVRIHGSQVAAVVLESTEHVEPFEEDTTTMIVFPRGAVVKLKARVRSGHAVVLTNALTKQTALCRIVQVNSAQSAAHYVKLEFMQPTPGFWGVHFPSDPLPSARPPEAPQPAATTPAAATTQKINIPAAPTKPAQIPQATTPIPSPAAPAVQTPPRTEAAPSVPKPPVREAARPASPATEYGHGTNGVREQIVPLAAAPPAPDRHETSTIRPPLATPVMAKAEGPAPAADEMIFDSFTTQEEVFPTHKAPGRASEPASEKRAGAIGYSSLLQTTAAAKPLSSALLFAGIAVIVLAIVAAGAMYARRHPTRVFPSGNTAAAAPSAAPPASTEVASNSPATTLPATPVQPQSSPSTAAPVRVPAAQDNSITVTPVPPRANETSPAPASHPTISTGMANIYAGDLSARPAIHARATAPVTAAMPNINGPATKEIPEGETNALTSLVAGGNGVNLAAPQPAPAQGGKVQLPKLLSSVAPIYPSLATANHVEGDVKIQAEIDATGKVISTKVISGPILLRSAAMDAVQRWKYSPATLDGKPIATPYTVMVRFRLNQ